MPGIDTGVEGRAKMTRRRLPSAAVHGVELPCRGVLSLAAALALWAQAAPRDVASMEAPASKHSKKFRCKAV